MKVVDSVLPKLQVQTAPCLLVGLRLGGSVLCALDVLNLPGVATDDGKPHAAPGEILPHGLSYVGVWAETLASAQQLLKEAAVQQLLLGSALPQTPIDPKGLTGILAFASGSSLTVHGVLLDQPDSPLQPPQAPQVLHGGPERPLAWLSDCCCRLIRCQTTLQLSVFIRCADSGPERSEQGTQAWHKAVTAAFEALQGQVMDPQLVFIITGSDGRRVVASPSSSGTVAGIQSSAESPAEALALKQPLPQDAAAPATPVEFHYQPVDSQDGQNAVVQQSCTVHLDVLAYVDEGQPLARLGKAALQPALLAQLQACKAAMLRSGRVLRCTPCHFLPPGRSHHLCLTYPVLKPDTDANDAALAPLRRELHALLGLPLDRPALRASNALTWQPEPSLGGAGAAPERLRDVHLGLSPPGASSDIHLLRGSYDYHHYMQDRFDDGGWGCAYRSLQTICSWFRLQQYTSKPVLRHREIQEILVRLGDKERSFVGSKQWIGAIELSYVLDEYLGVTCKIMTVNRGADIPSHARQLAAHFDSQGTPVMIGGGVLAYTLLGVYFNESTGDCAFLILDPHYTGSESIGRIHKGMWVGWKRPGEMAATGGPLFMQDAFYNFLCPQRPKEV